MPRHIRVAHRIRPIEQQHLDRYPKLVYKNFKANENRKKREQEKRSIFNTFLRFGLMCAKSGGESFFGVIE